MKYQVTTNSWNFETSFPINKTKEEFCSEMCMRELRLLEIIAQNCKNRLEKKLINFPNSDNILYWMK